MFLRIRFEPVASLLEGGGIGVANDGEGFIIRNENGRALLYADNVYYIYLLYDILFCFNPLSQNLRF